MTKNLFVTLVLFTGVAHSVQAQTFNVGDYVDAKTGSLAAGNGWEPCKVSRPMVRTQYGLDCGANMAYVQPANMRLRAATAEDKRVEAETAAALALLPRSGNGLSAQYGTREPVTCANRTAPAKGAPSAEQARQYFICDQEGDSATFLSLITNVTVQVAPASHRPDPRASYATAPDLNTPAWDIRGSFTQYSCVKVPFSLIGEMTAFARTHNCSVTEMPAATGFCYKNNFGDWHCPMRDGEHLNKNVRAHQLPPAGN